jgi:hypothetical protein
MFENEIGIASSPSFIMGRSMGITNGLGTGSPGIPKSQKTRERMREAALRRYRDPVEREKKLRAPLRKLSRTAITDASITAAAARANRASHTQRRPKKKCVSPSVAAAMP